MKKISNWIIAIVVFGLIGWATYSFIMNMKAQKEQVDNFQSLEETTTEESAMNLQFVKGDTAPDFELKTLDGEKVRLSDYEGQPVMVNFWASWCPPCRAEMPDIQRLHEETDYAILSINVTGSEASEKDVREFMKEYELTFETALDEMSAVATMYSAFSLPTTYFLDGKREIHEIVEGPLTYDAMLQIFERIPQQ